MKKLKSLFLVGIISLFITSAVFAQQTGTLTGQVFDAAGAVLPGATVNAIDSAGKEKTTLSGKDGGFTINGLAPGKYSIKASATGFSVYDSEAEIVAGQKKELIIALSVAERVDQVDVNTSNQVTTDPNENKDATVLSGKDLQDLPDDPDELQDYLQALAGPGAGPDGAQFNIDGFSGGRLPPKEAIREIRINQNPFSAEFDRVGFGRIDILTKPGYDQFHGSADFRFNDESLNSRNPFSANRAPTQNRNIGAYINGPIKAKKASFSIDFNQGQNDQSAIVNAVILDSGLNPFIFNQDYRQPRKSLNVGGRVDYLINDSNTLITRYSYSKNSAIDQGVGAYNLASRAYDTDSFNHEVRITETAIINPKTVNETRFSYEFNKSTQDGGSLIPSISVANAFTAGGAQVGNSFNKQNRWEINNSTTTAVGKNAEHPLKFGVRIRGTEISNQSESGYAGAFTFAGVRDPITGFVTLSSLDQYRQKVLGNPNPIYNPTQYTLTTGNPLASVSQIDYSFFATDDWKARKDLTVSMGLRYENQTNIKDDLNFAPRIGVAWAPGGGRARQAKTKFSGAFGLFFDRFSENTTLQARRNDGVSQLRYIVTDSTLLGQAVFAANNAVTNVPTAAQLAAFSPLSNVPYRIANGLQTPYSIQSAVTAEHQLPRRTVLTASFVLNRSLHTIRLRNINAPFCPTAADCPSGPSGLTTAQLQAKRPDPTQGNIFEYESSGYSDTKMVRVGFNTRLSTRVTIFSNYTLTFARNNANGSEFPSYTYDYSSDYSIANTPRQNFIVSGSVQLPFGFRFSPIMILTSARRFNITTGVDTNRDSLFTERPTYAQLNARCNELGLTNDFCNIGGIANPATTVIPRNYGIGPSTFSLNGNLSKTFSFGGSKPSAAANNNQNGQNGQNGQNAGNRGSGGGNRGGGGGGGGGNRGGGGGGGNRGGGGGGGGGQMIMMGGGGGGGNVMFMGGGGGGDSRRYNLTLSMNVNNVLNYVNDSAPSSQLSSPTFGRSISTNGSFFGGFGGGGGGFGGGGGGAGANRTVYLSARFGW